MEINDGSHPDSKLKPDIAEKKKREVAREERAGRRRMTISG